MARETANTRVWWRGVQLTARMRDALRWAEKRLQSKHPGVSIIPTQGSWSNGSLSGGTHSGAGAVDLRTWHLTTAQRIYLVRALKDAGLAAWYRDQSQGFAPHIHALDLVTTGMDSGARWQTVQYRNRRSGLTSNKPDPTYRPKVPVKFDYRLGKPVPL